VSDIYLTRDKFDLLAKFGRIVLRLQPDSIEERRSDAYDFIAVAAHFHDIAGKPVRIADHKDLVDALAAYTPAVDGVVDLGDVRWILGQHAGLFPEDIRAEEEPATLELGRDGVFVTAEEYAAMSREERERMFGTPPVISVPTALAPRPKPEGDHMQALLD
jgi:hypothetical protein